MKNLSNKLFLLLFAVLALNVTAVASEAVKGAKKDLAEFKKEMSVQLDGIEKKLSEVKAKAQTKGGEVQDKTVQELEATRDKLKVKIQNLNDDGKEGWRKFKADIVNTADKLNARLKKALE